MDNAHPPPSPPPRLRRSPKRSALHERPHSETNEVTFPSIRPITDADAKVYATTPYPTAESQLLQPSRGRAPPATTSPTTSTTINPPLHPGTPSSPVSRSHTPSATRKSRIQVLRDSTAGLLNAVAPRLLHPSAAHNDGLTAAPSPAPIPQLLLSGTAAAAAAAPSSPAAALADDRSASASSSSSAASLGVDRRLAMDRGYSPEGSHNEDGAERPRRHPQDHTQPRHPRPVAVVDAADPSLLARQISDGLRQHPPAPARDSSSSSRPRQQETPLQPRASLGAIASVASRASSSLRTPATTGSAAAAEATPGSGISVGSAGTVVRRRGFTGPTPAGYYSLFPPTPRSRPGSSRRRNSDPLRPLSGAMEGQDISPASSGSPGSPISPISGEGEAHFDRRAHESFYADPDRTRSDTALDMGGQDVRYAIRRQPSARNSGRRASGRNLILPSDGSEHFSIPRRPVAGRQSVSSSKWHSHMSTIQSVQSGSTGDDRTSSGLMTNSGLQPSMGSSLGIEVASFPVPASSLPSPREGGVQQWQDEQSQRQRQQQLQQWQEDEQRKQQWQDELDRQQRRWEVEQSRQHQQQRQQRQQQQQQMQQTHQQQNQQQQQHPEFSSSALRNTLAAAVALAADGPISPPVAVVPEEQEPPLRPRRDRKVTPPLSAYLPPPPPQKSAQAKAAARDNLLAMPRRERESLSVPKPKQKQNPNVQQRNSGSSFFLDAIPAWARTYYAHETRNRQTIGARPTSMSPDPIPGWARRNTFSPSHNRPETLRIPPRRPRRPDFLDDYAAPADPSAAAIISPAMPTHQPRSSRYQRQSSQAQYHYEREMRGGPRVVSGLPGGPSGPSGGEWSPRLIHNRISTVKRRTVFIAPSIDESFEARSGPGGLFSRRNIQVWSFVLGFVFPFAWIVAAWLPLPQKPRDSILVTPGFEQDLEKAFTGTDVARYENARWWRNVNRIMSPVGWLVIVAVVALVVVAVRET